MTVTNTTLKGGPYNGNGSTTAFATGFQFTINADVDVILTDSAGAETVQTETTHYTLTGAGSPSGGTVTMVTAPATGEKLTVIRDMTLDQQTDYTEGGKFPAETHEAIADKSVMIAQQQQEEINRTLRLNASTSGVSTTLPTASAGKALVWNAGETALQNSTTDVEALASSESNAAASATASAASATSAASSASNAAISASDAAASAASVDADSIFASSLALAIVF